MYIPKIPVYFSTVFISLLLCFGIWYFIGGNISSKESELLILAEDLADPMNDLNVRKINDIIDTYNFPIVITRMNGQVFTSNINHNNRLQTGIEFLESSSLKRPIFIEKVASSEDRSAQRVGKIYYSSEIQFTGILFIIIFSLLISGSLSVFHFYVLKQIDKYTEEIDQLSIYVKEKELNVDEKEKFLSTEDRKNFIEKINKLNDRINKMKTKNEKLILENEQLKKALNEAQGAIKLIYNKQITPSNQEISNRAKQIISALEKDIQKYKTIVKNTEEKYKIIIKELEEKLAKKSIDIDTSSVKSLNEESLEVLQKEKDTRIKDLENKLKQTEEETKELHNRIINLENKLDQKTKELEKEKKKCKDMEVEFEEKNKYLEQMEKTLLEGLDDESRVQVQLEEILSDNNKKSQEIKKLQDHTSDLEEKIIELESVIKDLEKIKYSKDDFKEKYGLSEKEEIEEKEILKKKLKKLDNETRAQNYELLSLNNRISEFLSEIDSSEKSSISTLGLKMSISELKSENRKYLEQINNLNQALKRIQTVFQRLKKDRDQK